MGWVGGLLLILAGCVESPATAPTAAAPIPSGQARVWFYRPWEPSESLDLALIDMNGSYVGAVANGSAFYRDVLPGHYHIAPESFGRDFKRKPQTAALVAITGETDRVYLDTPGRCAIEDRRWRRRIVIEKVGAASSVVWNPWADKAAAMVDLGAPAWRGMVCVETGNIADNEVRLAADDEH